MNEFTQLNVLCANSVCEDDFLLKKFLFKEDLRENKCEYCKQLPEWNEKRLEMEIYRKKYLRRNRRYREIIRN